MTTPLDKVTAGLTVADRTVGLLERLAGLFRGNPKAQARRKRARAKRVLRRGNVALAESLRDEADVLDPPPTKG